MSVDFASFVARIAGEAADEPLPEDAAPAVEKGPLADQLETAAAQAITRSTEILAMKLDPENQQTFGPTLRAITSTVGSVLGVQVRVDENRLRGRRIDILPKLLELIAAEEKRLAERRLATGPNSETGEVPP